MFPYQNQSYYDNDNRFFFVPFLVGAVAGGAAVGLTRPRPIVNAYPNQSYPPPMNYGYNYYGGYQTNAPYYPYKY